MKHIFPARECVCVDLGEENHSKRGFNSSAETERMKCPSLTSTTCPSTFTDKIKGEIILFHFLRPLWPLLSICFKMVLKVICIICKQREELNI